MNKAVMAAVLLLFVGRWVRGRERTTSRAFGPREPS